MVDLLKDILEKPESDISHIEAVEVDKELLKAEKVAKGEEEKTPPPQIDDAKFKSEAKEYLETPEITQKESYGERQDPVTAAIKNDREVANIIAAATLPSRPRKPKKQPRKVKKKPALKSKKMTTFRIATKKK